MITDGFPTARLLTSKANATPFGTQKHFLFLERRRALDKKGFAILGEVSLPPFQPLPLNRARALLSHPDWLFEVKWCAGWGYYPSGGLGLVLLIVIILALMGRL